MSWINWLVIYVVVGTVLFLIHLAVKYGSKKRPKLSPPVEFAVTWVGVITLPAVMASIVFMMVAMIVEGYLSWGFAAVLRQVKGR